MESWLITLVTPEPGYALFQPRIFHHKSYETSPAYLTLTLYGTKGLGYLEPSHVMVF